MSLVVRYCCVRFADCLTCPHFLQAKMPEVLPEALPRFGPAAKAARAKEREEEKAKQKKAAAAAAVTT